MPNHRTLRLCAQVARVLELCLMDYGPEDGPWLTVLQVEPDPGPSRLRVWIGFDPRDVERIPAARQALNQALPDLRQEVAGGIARKRVPDLVLQLHPLS